MARARKIVLMAGGFAAVLGSLLTLGCAAPDSKAVVYRDLKDIPKRPEGLITPGERQAQLQALEADRARAAQEADTLRREAQKMGTPSAPTSGQ